MTTQPQAFNCRPIRVGENYKLKGHRSHVDGRKALAVVVTEIIGGKGERESRHRFDTFIATDGRREFYGVKRSELLPL